MIRIGCLSERHDRRAQKEGFADKECDSDDGLFDEEDSTSIVPPSVNSNRDSLTADVLRRITLKYLYLIIYNLYTGYGARICDLGSIRN